MKALVLYQSNTGNTEKVTYAIIDALKQEGVTCERKKGHQGYGC